MNVLMFVLGMMTMLVVLIVLSYISFLIRKARRRRAKFQLVEQLLNELKSEIEAARKVNREQTTKVD